MCQVWIKGVEAGPRQHQKRLPQIALLDEVLRLDRDRLISQPSTQPQRSCSDESRHAGPATLSVLRVCVCVGQEDKWWILNVRERPLPESNCSFLFLSSTLLCCQLFFCLFFFFAFCLQSFCTFLYFVQHLSNSLYVNINRIVDPINENLVIVYLPSCRSKPDFFFFLPLITKGEILKPCIGC